MYQWNDKHLEQRYTRIKRDNLANGVDESILETPTLESWKFNTKSTRIWKMIGLAYDLGRMDAIKSIDEGKSKVTLQ